MKLKRTTWLIAGILAACTIAHADDSALEAVGGAVRPMRGHPSIRMVSEEVHIKLADSKVEATFIFKNEGPDTTVLIGFPEQGKDVEPRRYSHFDNFVSLVDGQKIQVTRRVRVRPTEDTDFEYKYWWVKQVKFKAGQTRTIVNRYAGGDFSTTYGIAGFEYILTTGANWKGPIGSARIVCDLGDVRNCSPISFGDRRWKRKGDVAVWERRNFEPDDELFIRWFGGFMNIEVNGHKVESGHYQDDLPTWSGDLGAMPPKREGSEVWTPIRAVAVWLDAQMVADKAGWQLKRTSHMVRIGKAGKKPGDGSIRSREQNDTLLVPLKQVAIRLGCTARFVGNKLVIRFPRNAASAHQSAKVARGR